MKKIKEIRLDLLGISNIYKYLCVLVFTIITVTVIAFSIFKSNTSKIVFTPVTSKLAQLNASIINPVLHGIDSKNQPYNVVAKKATEVSKNQIELEDLSAEVFTNSGKWLAALSKQGKFEITNSVLNLIGGVQLFTSDAEELNTDSLKLFLKEGKIVSFSPVVLLSNRANLKANGIEVSNSGKKIKFTGPINMTLFTD